MHEKISNAVTEFSTRLKEVFADDLLAVVLYGSAAGSAFREGRSDINVLIILEKFNAAQIFKFGNAAKTLMRNSRISPFIMTREEFNAAADVFPLEYCDILEKHTIVYGEKEILNINVSRDNLRLQLEEKLRGAAGDLRSMLLAAGGNEKLLGTYFLRWAGLGGVLFRGLLRLKGKNVSGMDSEAIIEEVEKEYKISLQSFSILNRMRQNKKPGPFPVLTLADTLLEPLSSLVHAVDSMDTKTK